MLLALGAALLATPGTSRAFSGQGHVVIEALAYRSLLEGRGPRRQAAAAGDAQRGPDARSTAQVPAESSRRGLASEASAMAQAAPRVSGSGSRRSRR
jgi:hypothetical protein